MALWAALFLYEDTETVFKQLLKRSIGGWGRLLRWLMDRAKDLIENAPITAGRASVRFACAPPLWWMYPVACNLALKGIRPMPPPGDFSKFSKKSHFLKLGQNRFFYRDWADLGLKFEFSVKNRSYSWAQTIISSFF